MKRILCFGDSNTWGFVPGSEEGRMAPEVRWPGVMQASLGSGYTVVEEAQNGRTTIWDDPYETIDKNGRRHLPVVLESQKPLDLVIIMLGTNDLKMHLNQTAHSIAAGAGVLVEDVLASDAGPGKAAPQVLLVAPVPVTREGCPFGHLFDDAIEKSAGFKEAYREVAEELGVPFLNAGDHASCPVPDAIHIDEEGCRSLGQAMAAKVTGILEG